MSTPETVKSCNFWNWDDFENLSTGINKSFEKLIINLTFSLSPQFCWNLLRFTFQIVQNQKNAVSKEYESQQLMQMLAVNGKVSGYCVHLPVYNLQTVKSTEKVFHPRKSTQWEQLLPSTCPELESMRTGGSF